MKQVLIIDAPPLFRDFLKEKLSSVGIEVSIASGRRDAFTKAISSLPDLILIDLQDSFESLMDFLQKKRDNPNAVSIPIILTGPALSQDFLAQLLPFKVIKYFNRPIKFDIFFDSIGRVLKTPLSIDTTLSIMETHLNDNIIFIEVAQGLNRDKIAMIRYKISEMIDANKLSTPKIVLMLTNLTLGFSDSANLEFLLNNVISDQRVRHKHIKILSLDSFTRDFVRGHVEYNDLEVVEDLSGVLATLINDSSDTELTDTIADKILSATDEAGDGLVEMRFFSETGVLDAEGEDHKKLVIAIVDDDAVVRTLLEKVFASINAEVMSFPSGSEFLAATNKRVFDLVILDVFMPGISGFDILMNLRAKQYSSPVIVYSNATQKASVVQALSLGAKSYLIKPLKPDAIIQKAIEVLNSKV